MTAEFGFQWEMLKSFKPLYWGIIDIQKSDVLCPGKKMFMTCSMLLQWRWRVKWIGLWVIYLFIFLLLLFLFCHFRAALEAYGGSQARGWIRAIVAGLCHSHRNSRFEPCLRPTPQLMATLDSWRTEWGQGLKLHPHGY